jgi:hypothetical protein
MRLKMGSRRAREVSIGLEMDGGGLVPPLLLLLQLVLPRLSESKSEAKEPTGEGESNSGIKFLPVEVTERFKLLLLVLLLLLLLLKADE